MSKVAVVGGGAGGAAAVAELVAAGHEVRFWSRSAQTLAPFQAQGGVAYDGILGEGLAQPTLMTADLAAAIEAAEVILICLPTFAHRQSWRWRWHAPARALPVVLNPGHTGGALEFHHAFRASAQRRRRSPSFPRSPMSRANTRPAASRSLAGPRRSGLRLCPGARTRRMPRRRCFAAPSIVPDVLACDLANVNMVLHAPGAVLGAAWVEATRGDFTFYVQGMTAGRRARHARAR